MTIRSLNRRQLRALLSYSNEKGTMTFELDTRRMPSELCRYKQDGTCRMRGIRCPAASFGCDVMCVKDDSDASKDDALLYGLFDPGTGGPGARDETVGANGGNGNDEC